MLRANGVHLSHMRNRAQDLSYLEHYTDFDVCLQKDDKQCCDVTKLHCIHCFGRWSSTSKTSFVTPQHCLNSFSRHTNIKISCDSGIFLEKHPGAGLTGAPCNRLSGGPQVPCIAHDHLLQHILQHVYMLQHCS